MNSSIIICVLFCIIFLCTFSLQDLDAGEHILSLIAQNELPYIKSSNTLYIGGGQTVQILCQNILSTLTPDVVMNWKLHKDPTLQLVLNDPLAVHKLNLTLTIEKFDFKSTLSCVACNNNTIISQRDIVNLTFEDNLTEGNFRHGQQEEIVYYNEGDLFQSTHCEKIDEAFVLLPGPELIQKKYFESTLMEYNNGTRLLCIRYDATTADMTATIERLIYKRYIFIYHNFIESGNDVWKIVLGATAVTGFLLLIAYLVIRCCQNCRTQNNSINEVPAVLYSEIQFQSTNNGPPAQKEPQYAKIIGIISRNNK